MAKKNFHVTPNSKGGWDVKVTGGTGSFRTKNEAIQAARDIAKKESGSDVVIHGKDGRIVTKYTYGRDPSPPKEDKRTSSKKGGTSITGPKKADRN